MNLTLTSTSLRAGGISAARIFLIIRLSSGFPGIIAGPDFPPLSMLSRVRRSSPASFFLPP